MKANLYSLILFFFLTAGTPAVAQPATVVVSGYYTVNDYHFSSRINRFHKSYAEFSYYSPVFTDTYWYSYSPFTRGVSIYGGGAARIGYSGYYPVYDYYDGWYDPYYGYSSYWGYQPVYYSWFAPVFVNVNRVHHYPDQFWYGNTYRQRNTTNVYNITNNYYSSPSSRRTSYSGNYGVTRRESTPVSNTSGSGRVPESTRPTGNRNNAGRDPGRDPGRNVSNSGRVAPGNQGNNGTSGNNGNNGNHYGNVNNDGNPNTVNNSDNNRNNAQRERIYNPGNSNRNEGTRTSSNKPSSVNRSSGSQSTRSGSVQKRSVSSGSQATKSNTSSDSPSSTSSGSSRRRK